MASRNGEKVKRSKKYLQGIGKQAASDFVRENNYFGGAEETYQSAIGYSKNITKIASRSNNSEIALSSEFQNLWAGLTSSLNEAVKKGPERLKKDIEDLSQKAQSSLNETELIAFYAGASTAYGSFLYWSENHRKWQIALNAPELLSQLSDDELNKVKIKNGKFVSPVSRSWWDDAWGAVGEAWDATTDYVSDWWNNGGSDVVGADAGSAVSGAIGGALAGSAAGGAGAVPGAIIGGIGGGCLGSIEESISQMIN